MSESQSPDVEQSLIARIRQADQEALAEYIGRHQGELLGFIQKRMSDALRKKVEPDDVLQELTVSALAGLAAGRSEANWEPMSWLFQQAERRIVDAHRKHFAAQKRAAGREAGLPGGSDVEGSDWEDLLAASMTSASAAFSRRQKEFHVLQAMETLPDDAREALRLRYVEGLPSKEIAARLGRTDGAVRVLLTRTLHKLQEILSHNDDFHSLLVPKPSADLPVPPQKA